MTTNASTTEPQFRPRKRTDYIVIHCSADPPSRDIGVAEIRREHLARGFIDIGYHLVIRRNGSLEDGRPPYTVGSHVQGLNEVSFGICLVGGMSEDEKRAENNFTPEQFATLEEVVKHAVEDFPTAKVVGHKQLDKHGKECPSFDADQWATQHGFPTTPGEIYWQR